MIRRALAHSFEPDAFRLMRKVFVAGEDGDSLARGIPGT